MVIQTLKLISIPVRYDWNPELYAKARSNYLFQFQLGTIGTPSMSQRTAKALISIPVRYDWNTFVYNGVKTQYDISIPVRYDWNTKLNLDNTMAYYFNSS